jgi:hypothetical protein
MKYYLIIHFNALDVVTGFQRRRLKCEKLPDDSRRTPSDGKSSHCLWQGELKKNDIAVHKELFNGFGVSTTLKVSQHQAH